jgi:branched-chain amino acid transport system ATP-binding protein
LYGEENASPSKGLAPIVLAEQNLDFVLALSERRDVLEKGSVAYAGTSAELADNAAVQNRYLHV